MKWLVVWQEILVNLHKNVNCLKCSSAIISTPVWGHTVRPLKLFSHIHSAWRHVWMGARIDIQGNKPSNTSGKMPIQLHCVWKQQHCRDRHWKAYIHLAKDAFTWSKQTCHMTPLRTYLNLQLVYGSLANAFKQVRFLWLPSTSATLPPSAGLSLVPSVAALSLHVWKSTRRECSWM